MSRVSILMPVYNAEHFIREAIESILSQSFEDWELILINDGSTDSSESIIHQFDSERIYYIKNKQNLGLIKTLNKGFEYCHGEYIARMDADDISLRDRLLKQVHFLDKHPDYVMCGTNAIVINNNNRPTGKIRNLTGNDFLQVNLLFSPPFIHPSVMIRREVLQANQYDEEYKHVEDYELWCRIARSGKIANINKDLLEYRWHNSNVSVINNEMQDRMKNKVIINQLKSLDLYPSTEELYCHTITFKLYRLGNRQNVPEIPMQDVFNWFTKILEQNKLKKIYNQSNLTAFLWSRWLVLCIAQQKYGKILSPSFRSFKPSVLIKLLKLILLLRQKQ